jgi:hypothetical protein
MHGTGMTKTATICAAPMLSSMRASDLSAPLSPSLGLGNGHGFMPRPTGPITAEVCRVLSSR